MRKGSSMTYEQAALEVLAEDGVEQVWFGDPDVWHGIYERKNGHNDRHPLDQWYAVYAALKRSRRFEQKGYINAPGFTTNREIAHPCFVLRKEENHQ